MFAKKMIILLTLSLLIIGVFSPICNAFNPVDSNAVKVGPYQWGEDKDGKFITVIVQNVSGQTLDSVNLRYAFFDNKNYQIDNRPVSIWGLAANESAKYRIDAPNDAISARLIDISVYAK